MVKAQTSTTCGWSGVWRQRQWTGLVSRMDTSRLWSQWMMAGLVLNRLRLKGLMRATHSRHRVRKELASQVFTDLSHWGALLCVPHLGADTENHINICTMLFWQSHVVSYFFKLIYVLVLYSFDSTALEKKQDHGHSPLDLRGGGGGAPNQLLRRGGGEGEGDFRGLGGRENGAVRGLWQVQPEYKTGGEWL